MVKTKPSILVVDDEESMLKTYKAILKNNYAPILVNSGQDAVKQIQENPFSLVILDIMMPEMSGIEVLQKIKQFDPALEVIVVTAAREIKSAVQAIKLGAYDYLTKPFEVEELLSVMEKALERRSLVRENAYLRKALEEKGSYLDLIGKTEAIQKIFNLIDKVSATNSTVLITGESGTGKELVAHAIYKKSPRANGPYIVVNCAAIPENLMESELFGHERGAFTGALERKEGKFELADGGTIFLDEIGCMRPALQSKLLRVLQDNIVERVGGSKPQQVDVRVIAATNLDMQAAIRKGEFREDLFYRLNVIPLHLPPLREREEDIPLFLDHFLNKFNREFNKAIKGFSPTATEILVNYSWPGNVRELQNLVERIAAISDNNSVITENDLPFDKNIIAKGKIDLKEKVNDFELSQIKKALKEADGNQTKAAKILGIHRSTLLSKMEEFGLR